MLVKNPKLTSSQRKANLRKMITSERTFGVEVETGIESHDGLSEAREKCGGWLRTTQDLSITAPNGTEFITQVLKGSKGVDTISKMCGILNDYNFITDDISCAMHVHLGGGEFLNKVKIIPIKDDIHGFMRKKGDYIKNLVYVDESLSKLFSVQNRPTARGYIRFVDEVREKIHDVDFVEWNMGYRENQVAIMKSLRVDNVSYPCLHAKNVDRFEHEIARIRSEQSTNYLDEALKKRLKASKDGAEKAKHRKWHKLKKGKIEHAYIERVSDLVNVRNGMYVAVIEDGRVLNRAKALLYFYVIFNDVFRGMVAPSRVKNNAYCMPISEFFELEQIMGLKSYEDFEKLWYKDEDKNKIERDLKTDHFNNSRYLDVNFHSLWNRTNTIEFRLHGSTKNPSHIIMWTALHQHIVDLIAKDKLSLETIVEATEGCESVSDKYKAMDSILELPEHLQEYVKRLLKHFSGVTIK
jgi:hypothetical protein